MDQLLLLLTGTGSKGLDLDPDAQALLARLKVGLRPIPFLPSLRGLAGHCLWSSQS